MAYQFTAASSQYLSSLAPLTNVPLTICCWVKFNSNTGADQIAVSIGNGVTHRLQIGTFNLQNFYIASVGTTQGTSEVTGDIAVNSWNHICGVTPSTSSRTIYKNGIAGTTNNTNIALNNFTEVLVGARRNTALGLFTNGNIAEVGIWNAALTAAEIASLAKGMTCDKVRPQSLVFYAPLVRDLTDQKGGLSITNNNGATVATHTRVYA